LKEYAKDIFSELPEGFYDGLAYIIPATYLLIGVELLYGFLFPWTHYYFSIKPSWVIDLLLALGILGGLYLVGQILTVFSYYLILIPLHIIGFYEGETWYKKYRWIEVELSSVSLLVTKRYARWMSSLNMALSSMILIVLSLITEEYTYAVVFLLMSVVFVFDLAVRYRWLQDYVDTIIQVAEEQSRRPASSKRET